MQLLSHLLEQDENSCASRKVWTNTEKTLEERKKGLNVKIIYSVCY